MIFTVLSGDACSSRPKPLAYVLQIDDVKVLLDCGSPEWCPESFQDPNTDWTDYCSALERISPSIDLVLLSHGDLSHVGLYAYAQAHWGLHAPTYASLPVQAMGRIAITEEAEDIRASQDVGEANTPAPESESQENTEMASPSNQTNRRLPFIATATEITAAFENIVTLRYSQPTHLSGKCQGLTITAYAAGHTLGGTVWKIRSASSGTIQYAVNLNHMKERHLEGTALIKSGAGGGGSVIFEPLARPDLLITDAERTLATSPRRKDRDAVLLETITTTLEEAHKSVLIPCDTSARLLELLLMFDQHWQFARLRAPICLVSRTGKEMLSVVRSLVEWMSGGAGLEDDETGTATLKLRHLEFFASPSALLQTYPSFPTSSNPNPKPKLILAVPASLSHGPSRELFAEFAKVPGNLIVLASVGETGSLSRSLFDRWASSTGLRGTTPTVGAPIDLQGESLRLAIHSKVPLEGAELEEYLAQERAAREREAAAQSALARSQRILEADEGGDDGSDSSDEEDAVEGGTDSNSMTIDEPSGAALDWSMLDNAEDSQAHAQQVSFDIYLRGNTVARTATSFFKSGAVEAPPPAEGEAAADAEAPATESSQAPGEGLTRYRMFPLMERRKRVDAYGETLDVGTWMRKSRALEEEARIAANTADDPMQLGGEVDIPAQEVNVPSKFVVNYINVPLHCQAFYVDMEGLNDGRAIKTIVPQVNPRKMIIVHASSEATAALVSSCASIRTMTKEIFHPATGEALAVGQQTNTYSIMLSDEVLENVHMSRFEDNHVGHIYGRVSVSADSSIPILEAALAVPPAGDSRQMAGAESHAMTSTSKPKTLTPRLPSSLPRSTIIGDLKLTALKSRLAALGVNAEFAGEGVLVCNGASADSQVAVKKMGRGQVMVEGAPSQVYYLVRQEVYGLHAVVVS